MWLFDDGGPPASHGSLEVLNPRISDTDQTEVPDQESNTDTEQVQDVAETPSSDDDRTEQGEKETDTVGTEGQTAGSEPANETEAQGS